MAFQILKENEPFCPAPRLGYWNPIECITILIHINLKQIYYQNFNYNTINLNQEQTERKRHSGM